jgi:hypothetical protein
MMIDEAEIQSDVVKLGQLWREQLIYYNKLKILEKFENFKEFDCELHKFGPTS